MKNGHFKDRICTVFFRHNEDVVSINDSVEGYCIDDEGRYIFGAKVGPTLDLGGVIHEICHFINRDIGTLLERPPSSWGFSFGKEWVIGSKSGHECITDQASMREIEVFAMELVVRNYFMMEDNVQESASVLRHMPDWCFLKKRLMAGRVSIGYREDEMTCINKAASLIRQKARKYTMSSLLHEWNLRIRALRRNKKENGNEREEFIGCGEGHHLRVI